MGYVTFVVGVISQFMEVITIVVLALITSTVKAMKREREFRLLSCFLATEILPLHFSRVATSNFIYILITLLFPMDLIGCNILSWEA